MKIPFEDRRINMNRRWTDLKRFRELRVQDLIDAIETCTELGKNEFLQLKHVIERRLEQE